MLTRKQRLFLIRLRRNRRFRQVAQVFLDGIASLAALFLSLRLVGLSISGNSLLFFAIPFGRIIANAYLNSYKQLWRYYSVRQIQNVLISTAIISSLLIAIDGFYYIFPPRFIFLEAALFFLLASGFRVLRRFTLPKVKKGEEPEARKRTLFLGAGSATARLIDNIRKTNAPFMILGALDDDRRKVGAEIQGVPVLDHTIRLESYVRKFNIEQVIIAMPSASNDRIHRLVSQCRRLNVKVKVIPSLDHWLRDHNEELRYNITLADLKDDKEITSTYAEIEKKQDKILVTGGFGYIGLHLVKQLLDAGKKVKVLENFSFGKSFLPDYINHPNLEVVTGDIANIKDVVEAVKDVETIIALAAIVGDPACSVNAEETLTLNYEATKTLVETANFYGVKRLVFASSCSVYGASDTDLLNEESALNPVSLYAKTRIMSEDIIFSRCGKMEPVVLRLATVFGYSPRMRYDLVINTLTIRAMVENKFMVFGGNQWRPFVHCADVANAFYLAATGPSEAVAHEIFNVGSTDMNATITDAGKIIHSIFPNAEFVISDEITDPRNYRVDFTKIHSQLGFEKKYTIEMGVKEIIEKIGNSTDLKNYKNPVFSNYQTIQQRFVKEEDQSPSAIKAG